MSPRLPIEAIVPGGIRDGDVLVNDETCSRCRRAIAEDEVPIKLWARDGHGQRIYCDDCTGLGGHRGPEESPA